MLRKRRPMMADINVTPFVDVMLVLLVIFMITAPLMQHGLEVQLPQESTKPIQVKEIPSVTLKNNKKIFWNEDEMLNLLILSSKVKEYLRDNQDWIKLLKSKIIHASISFIPVLGICFGHQIIGEALGGKVTKNKKGWELGSYKIKINHYL